MRRSRRGIRDGEARDLELADVNEQELAKAVVDGKAESDAEEASDDKPNEEKQSCMENSNEKNSAETETQFVIVEQSGGEIVARGEGTDELVRSADEETEAEGEETGESLGEDSEPPMDGGDGDEGEGEESQDNNRMGRIYVAVIAVCLMIALIVLGLSAVYGTKSGTDARTESSEEDGAQTDDVDPPSGDVKEDTEVLGSLSGSAVSVIAESDGGELFYASGTAVLEGGCVATVYSAIKGARNIKIVLDDGSVYPADVLAYNESVGLALLSTDARELRAVKVGETEPCVGETVYAVGNADGSLSSSFFEGVVSYTSRRYEFNTDGGTRIAKTVQIGGFDNESMLGCPVFNQGGEAIAIVVAALAGKNTCLALPIDGVLTLLDVMKNGGEPSKETLEAIAYSPASLSVWGKQSCVDGIWGVEITSFEDGEGDSAVKLRRGDLIYRINDTFVAGTDALKAQLSELRRKDEVQIYVLRGGQRLSFDVILG